MAAFIEGVLAIANFFLAVFVLIYAALFLLRSVHHKDRRPWEFLFIAILVFVIINTFTFLSLMGMYVLPSAWYNFLFLLLLAFILMSFIFQHKLIADQNWILISRKGDPVEKKKTKKK